jgi:hypothetical protein
MDPTVEVNEQVDVVVIYKPGDVNSRCIPYKMRWHGQEIALNELALKFPTVAGRRMVHVFNVSDGANDYRLEFDAEALIWTLISLIPGTAGTSGTSGTS